MAAKFESSNRADRHSEPALSQDKNLPNIYGPYAKYFEHAAFVSP